MINDSNFHATPTTSPGLRLLVLLGLLLQTVVCPAVVTFNGAATNQVIDGIGVNVNYRSWEGTSLQPVLDAFIDQAGISLFRVVHDLSDWEAVNDNADPNSMNWDYYNGVYGSADFARLWDTLGYFNARGITNGAFFCFMGWGPSWLMDPNVTASGVRTSLQPGLEAEWAEMIGSALIYARNTRGLQFSLVAPNNETDTNFEGIRMDTASQYKTALRKLADFLDANNVTNLSLVGPDRAGGSTGYEFMPEMVADPVLMARVKHFSTHSFSDGDGFTPAAFNYIDNSAYADRRLWVTEFNRWCPGCDSGQLGNYGWDYTRATAEHLIRHLQNGASAALVWEGYDSVYAHHFNNWSYWGLFGVNNTSDPMKTYTARKHFYTVSQVSKWVRPGAQRISLSGSTSPFTPLAAFKHAGLRQVVIAGVNPNASTATLAGNLTALPTLTNLKLYYTSATTNLAFAGAVAVNNGTFNAAIPANCVFTLAGVEAPQLTNGIPRAGSNSGVGTLEDRYQFVVTNPVARLQFEIISPTADVTLLVRKDVPPESEVATDYRSANAGTSGELIVVRPGGRPQPVLPGVWFLTVLNNSGTNATYSVRVTQWVTTGLPILINPGAIADGQFCFTWNSLPGASYVVQGSTGSGEDWTDDSGTIEATSSTAGICLQLMTTQRFYRVAERVAINP